MAEFTIGNSISFGWDKMKDNFVLYLCIILTIVGVEIVGGALGKIELIGWIFAIATIIAMMLIKIGVYSISLGIVDGKEVKYSDLISQPSLLFDFILATILYILIVIGGLILLIVPGIMWAIKYQFYGYAIIDKKMDATDALKESGRITHGHKWTLFGMWFASIGVILLGLLCLIVGIVVAIPVVEIAWAFAYRSLSTGAVAATPTATPAAAPVSAPVAPATPEPAKESAPVVVESKPAKTVKKAVKKVVKKKVVAKKKQ